ncbi:MAG: cytochrome c maturation protein CcmE [Desulfovibrionaceae bacterium]
MPEKKNSKAVYIAALALLLAGLGYLVASGLSQGSTPTLTVAQTMALAPGEAHKVRLYGKVAEAGIERGDLGVRFLVHDEGDPARGLPVDFTGAVPDTFAPGVEVILKGSLDGGVFEAVQMTTKCPSKYEEKRQPGA